AVIVSAGRTKIGVIMPNSAAWLGPRSEVSSQGWTTTVLAGGTSFASEMSLSYLLVGGCPKGPPVVMTPISLSCSMLIISAVFLVGSLVMTLWLKPDFAERE